MLFRSLVNFLCLLGWNPGDDREKMSIADIIGLFDLPGVNQSNARFDDRKLAHMNMAYLLELPPERFLAVAREHLARREEPAARAALAADPAYFREVMLLCQPKLKGVEELPAYTGYFFSEEFAVDAKVREKLFAKGDPKARLRELRAELAAMDFSRDAAIEEAVKAIAARGGFGLDRKSTRLNSSHVSESRMPSSA